MIKQEYKWTPGAGAVTKNIELSKRAIAAVIISCDALGNTGAGTKANMLTQFGTEISLKDGGVKVTPAWSATQWNIYLKHFMGLDPLFPDGTAANNTIVTENIIIPMGRPLRGRQFGGVLDLIDPLVGFVPKNIPELYMSVPADGGTLDTRNLKVTVLYHDVVPKYNKLWTPWASQTLSTSTETWWKVGEHAKRMLLEMFLFQTTEWNTNMASEVPTILSWRLTKDGANILTDGNVSGQLLFATVDETFLAGDDQYFYFPLSFGPWDNLRNCIKMDKMVKLGLLGGVADAATAAFSLIEPSGKE